MNVLLRQPSNKTWIIEGVLLAILPFVAYTMHYMYQLGYAAFFHIPPSFIPLEVSSDLIWLTVILYIVFIYLYIIIRALTSFLDLPLINVVSKLILIVKLLPLFLPGILGKKWYARLVALLGEESMNNFKRQSYAILAAQVATQVTILIAIVLALFVIPYQTGRACASGKTVFYTCSVSGSEKLVILEKYDNTLITAPLNESKGLSNSFRIIHLSDIPDQRLTIEDLGHIGARSL